MADLTSDYRYKVLKILHVADGDTMDIRVELKAHVDFGFSIRRWVDGGTFDIRVRLSEIDTWEKSKLQLERGKAAEEFAREWLTARCNKGHLHVYTKPDKKTGVDAVGNFRRWLAEFRYEYPGIDKFPTLHAALRAEGHEKNLDDPR
jgi:endonuclease YncB( thermonuclease family)